MPDRKPKIVVAVLDSGVLAHEFADGTILPPLKFIDEQAASEQIKQHGTAVAASILTIAPFVKILPFEVTNKYGQLTTPVFEQALQWILTHHGQQRIKIICTAFTDYTNNRTDEGYEGTKVKKLIEDLAAQGVVTVAAAGNWYADFNASGIGWPAILRHVVSVGALTVENDEVLLANTSQRLNEVEGTGCYTTVFTVPDAPGYTSGATAVVVGKLANLLIHQPDLKAGELIAELLVHRRFIVDKSGNQWPIC